MLVMLLQQNYISTKTSMILYERIQELSLRFF